MQCEPPSASRLRHRPGREGTDDHPEPPGDEARESRDDRDQGVGLRRRAREGRHDLDRAMERARMGERVGEHEHQAYLHRETEECREPPSPDRHGFEGRSWRREHREGEGRAGQNDREHERVGVVALGQDDEGASETIEGDEHGSGASRAQPSSASVTTPAAKSASISSDV